MNRPAVKMHRAPGFSLVELIIVIVLIGIMAVVVFPRFFGPNTFQGIGTRDAAIATARAAQQLALGRGNVTFEIDPVAGEWVFSARSGGTVLRSTEVDGSGITLETGGTGTAGTCATSFDNPVTSSFVVTYDEKGNAATFDNGGGASAIDNGVRICINDDVTLSVCISPGGFAHEGNCVD